MIHTLRGPARRLAVVEVPRDQYNRLGRIGSPRRIGSIGTYDWTRIPNSFTRTTDEPYLPAQPWNADGTVNTEPPQSAQWIAAIIAGQSAAREATPGSLTYTPAPTTGPPTIARWNSWAGPCTAPGASLSVSANGNGTGAATPDQTNAKQGNGNSGGLPAILYIAAALGAAASAAYLLNSLTGER
jgi:hypothetical protein